MRTKHPSIRNLLLNLGEIWWMRFSFLFSFAFSQICIKFKMPVTVGYVSKSLNCDSRQDSRLPDPILFSPYSSNHVLLWWQTSGKSQDMNRVFMKYWRNCWVALDISLKIEHLLFKRNVPLRHLLLEYAKKFVE